MFNMRESWSAKGVITGTDTWELVRVIEVQS